MSKSDFLLLLVLALLPVQLAKFTFPESSYVLGLPIDYRAVAIYASDLAIISFIAASVFTFRGKLTYILKLYKDYILVIFIFNLYLLFTTKDASLFFNLKIFTFSLMSIFAAYSLKSQKLRQEAALILGFSVFWQSALIIFQFLNQGAIGLKILGERSFDASTVLIAHSELFGTQLLRPYGTFPHPNVAAAYLTFSLILLFPAFKFHLALLPVLAIFLTASRSAIAVLFTAYIISIKNFKNALLLAAGAILVGTLLFLQLAKYQVATIAERLLLSQAALDISLQNPLFGVGSNNFILELSKLNLFSLSETRLLQPVHNVFLLILAENGLVGLLLFTAVLLVISRYLTTYTKIILFFAVLFYFSIDHFLWTLHQGQMMFWLLIAYFLSDRQKA